ncbi:hypothetical protein Q7C36_011010 [Tachysurus vachellii]|uniref:Uncharacterized protein n=1 Tax=Tachysurus vachellii TaxID=175792 RepID=A0AA88MVL3_TACVA|nr:hypothetical protein Q7C36_011010 [Tachysurus vachellii]
MPLTTCKGRPGNRRTKGVPSRTAVQIKTLSDVRDLGPPFLRSGEEKKHPVEWQNTQSRERLTKLALLEGTQKVEGQKEGEKERQKKGGRAMLPVPSQ